MTTLDVIGFSHIGIVVPSIADFQASWGRLLGLSGWKEHEIRYAPGASQTGGEVLNDPDARGRIAITRFGGTSLEIIEPVGGDSNAARWLAARGGGVNHIGVWVRDLSEALRQLDTSVEITYSPAALATGFGSRAIAASVDASAVETMMPSWAYVRALDSVPFDVELMDAGAVEVFRAFFEDSTYFPGDLPDHRR